MFKNSKYDLVKLGRGTVKQYFSHNQGSLYNKTSLAGDKFIHLS